MQTYMFSWPIFRELNGIIGLDISNYKIRLSKGISSPQILLQSFLEKCSPFYFYDTGTDILLGNKFFPLFHKVVFYTFKQQIHFKRPCGH